MKEHVWIISGMVLTKENHITLRKTCSSAKLSTTHQI